MKGKSSCQQVFNTSCFPEISVPTPKCNSSTNQTFSSTQFRNKSLVSMRGHPNLSKWWYCSPISLGSHLVPRHSNYLGTKHHIQGLRTEVLVFIYPNCSHYCQLHLQTSCSNYFFLQGLNLFLRTKKVSGFFFPQTSLQSPRQIQEAYRIYPLSIDSSRVKNICM